METTCANNDFLILDRVVAPEQSDLPVDVAHGFLRLSFPEEDRHRMNGLAEKARLGTLTAEEQDEVNSYERVGHLLSLLKSKARRSLKSSTHRP